MSENPDQPASPASSPALKADFSHLYNQPSPRPYFAALKPLEYRIPQPALAFVNRILDTFPRDDGKPRKVLDVCCSYGINAALLRHDLSFDDLALHYESTSDLTSYEEQVVVDKQFFASRLSSSRQDLQVIGLDVAPNAIRYATDTGLLTPGGAGGFVEDLEAAPPSDNLRAALRDVGLVVCTGGVGYVGAPTFGRIAAANARPGDLWMVAFVLRIYPFDETIGVELQRFGLVADKIPGVVFKQRRFVSPEEQRAAVATVRARGMYPAGVDEEGGWYYAECFVVHPAETDAGRNPVDVTGLFSNLTTLK